MKTDLQIVLKATDVITLRENTYLRFDSYTIACRFLQIYLDTCITQDDIFWDDKECVVNITKTIDTLGFQKEELDKIIARYTEIIVPKDYYFFINSCWTKSDGTYCDIPCIWTHIDITEADTELRATNNWAYATNIFSPAMFSFCARPTCRNNKPTHTYYLEENSYFNYDNLYDFWIDVKFEIDENGCGRCFRTDKTLSLKNKVKK